MGLSEDTVITIVAVVMILGALSIGHFFKNTKGMKIFITLMSPFTWLKDRVDPNYWASRIGNREGGIYDRARNSKSAKWVNSLEGRKWWIYQIGGGLLFVIVIEFLLNLIGISILPWR